jgi:hypothetical protein
MAETDATEHPKVLLVPGEEATWSEIWKFALTYNAYDRDGGFEGAAQIGDTCAERWRERRWRPSDLKVARAALFFEYRRYRHFGGDPSGPDGEYVHCLLDRIRELSGGKLAGPPDDLP